MKKYEAPEAQLILLEKEEILADSANPTIGKGDQKDGSTATGFGSIPLW